MGSSEEVAERVIQQIDERRRIEIGVTHHLTGKECLPGATAEQASHHPIAHVHVMSHFLNTSLDGTNVWALIATAIKVLVEFSQEDIQTLKLFKKC